MQIPGITDPVAARLTKIIPLTLALLLACDGQIADPRGSGGAGGGPGGPGGGGAALCEEGVPSVEARELRRLTPAQLRNTLRDLVGDPGLEPNIDDDANVLTERGVRQLRTAAELIVSRRDHWTRTVFPCDPAGPADDACAEQMVDDFAQRAFRRPPTAEEREWLLGIYGDARAELGFADALEVLAQVILQSPQLVYVQEEGVAREGLPDGLRALTSWEVASRLSYFLWNTMPDDALFAAAASGTLETEAGLREQVERMLADPRAEHTLQSFFWQWLQLDGGQLHHALEDTDKDAEMFPEYGSELQAAMRTELEAFVRRVVLEEGGGFDALLTDNRAYVNGPLAALYGVEDGPATADEWAWVELDDAQRGGLLTRAAFLTVFASSDVRSPIRRGVFVVEEVLCNGLGEPPPNASDVPVGGGEVEDGSGGTVVRTVREDVEARTGGEPCSTCHSVINPVGFAFEHYDAIGRWQNHELQTGLPIDSTGRLQGSDVDGDLADALDLSRRLARSERVRGCFADRWMTRALGEKPGTADACSRQAVQQRFRETGDIRELLVSIVTSDTFRYLAIPEEDR